jgi:stage III sporulation protein AD
VFCYTTQQSYFITAMVFCGEVIFRLHQVNFYLFLGFYRPPPAAHFISRAGEGEWVSGYVLRCIFWCGAGLEAFVEFVADKSTKHLPRRVQKNVPKDSSRVPFTFSRNGGEMPTRRGKMTARRGQLTKERGTAMGIFQVVIIGVLGVVLAILMKGYNPALSLILSLATGVIIFLMVVPMLANALGFVRHLGDMADGLGVYTTLAVRVIGVAYIAEMGASVCNDANESAIAAKIDLAGRLIILVMAMPVSVDIVRINGIYCVPIKSLFMASHTPWDGRHR